MTSMRSHASLVAIGLMVLLLAVVLLAVAASRGESTFVVVAGFPGDDLISLEHVRNLLRTRDIDVREEGSIGHVLSVPASRLRTASELLRADPQWPVLAVRSGEAPIPNRIAWSFVERDVPLSKLRPRASKSEAFSAALRSREIFPFGDDSIVIELLAIEREYLADDFVRRKGLELEVRTVDRSNDRGGFWEWDGCVLFQRGEWRIEQLRGSAPPLPERK